VAYTVTLNSPAGRMKGLKLHAARLFRRKFCIHNFRFFVVRRRRTPQNAIFRAKPASGKGGSPGRALLYYPGATGPSPNLSPVLSN
jgi:hypothetical protein